MKKQISVLLSIIMLCSILILPVSAYTTVDYSCYIGEWAGNMVSSEGWSNDAKISITQAENATSTEPASISFSFSYRQLTFEKKGVPVVNNEANIDYYILYNPFVVNNDLIGFDTVPPSYDSSSYYHIMYKQPQSWDEAGTIKLKFYEEGIWVEWFGKEGYRASLYTSQGDLLSGMFYNPNFQYKEQTVEETNITVMVNGEPLTFDQSPIMQNDRVLVPIRKVFETINADVYFDIGQNMDGTNFPIITAIKGNTRVTLYEDSSDGWIMKKGKLTDNGDLRNDNEIQIYTQPILLNGRTLVPVRAITEAFGANVDWDGNTQTVVITGDTSGQRKSNEEMKKIGEFDSKAACHIANEKYYVFYAYEWPGYDSKGKYYILSVSDNGTQNGNQSSIRVYIDGTIIEEG